MPYRVCQSEHDPSILYALWGGRFDHESIREFKDSGCNALRLSAPLYTKDVDFEAVSELRELRGFHSYGIGSGRQENFSFLCCTDHLEEFATDKAISPRSGIEKWRGLKRFYGKWPKGLITLANWPRLEHLNISAIRSVSDFAPGGCDTLNVLQVFHSASWDNPNLETCPNLVRFESHFCPSLNQLDSISQLRSLEIISLSQCKSIEHLPAFGSSVKRVEIEACGEILSFGPEPVCLPQELFIIDCDLGELAMEQIKSNSQSFTQLVLPTKYRKHL